MLTSSCITMDSRIPGSKNRIHIPIQFRYALSADLHWQWRVQSCGRLTGPPFLARLGGMRQKMMDIESLRPRGVVSVSTFQQIGRARVIFFWLFCATHSLSGSLRKRGCYHWPVFGWLLGEDLEVCGLGGSLPRITGTNTPMPHKW